MAKTKKAKPSDLTEDPILKEARERFLLAYEADTDMRKRWADDTKFNAGDQWDSELKKIRENARPPRPCLTVPLTQLHTRQVINDMRQNRPSIKVLPVDSGADKRTADIFQGLVRNIEVCSDADIAYDTSALCQVEGGFGYFRIVTEVLDEKLNIQDARIKAVYNPLCVFLDPFHEHPAGQDAEWGFIVQDLSRERLKRDYPGIELLDWKGADEFGGQKLLWYPDEKSVRVAEYLYTELEEKDFFFFGEEGQEDEYDEERALKLIQSGQLDMSQFRGTRTRKVKCVYWTKMIGNEILEQTKYPSEYIGIIRCPGMERIIDGKRDVRGMVFDLKDQQRLYNYVKSAMAERNALVPKAPYIAPDEAIELYEDDWIRSTTENLAFLKYKSKDENGNPIQAPQRASPVMGDPGLSNSLIQEKMDLEYAAGRFEATIGAPSNEKSGRAILARKQGGEVSTFHFSDNQSRAIRYAGRVLVDMIPRIYDTPRMIRVLGEDNKTDFAMLDPKLPRAYQEEEGVNGKLTKVYNLGVGKYDVVVSSGPSYQTKRQEAQEFMTSLVQADATLMQKAGDKILRFFDMPGADELADRLEKFLPSEIQDDGENEQDKVNQAVQAAQQQMMAQIEPMLGQLKQALDEAAKDAQQKDGQIQMLKVQLANRETEQITRIKEAVIEAMSRREVAEIQAEASTRDSVIDASARHSEADAQVTQEFIRANAVRQANPQAGVSDV